MDNDINDELDELDIERIKEINVHLFMLESDAIDEWLFQMQLEQLRKRLH